MGEVKPDKNVVNKADETHDYGVDERSMQRDVMELEISLMQIWDALDTLILWFMIEPGTDN